MGDPRRTASAALVLALALATPAAAAPRSPQDVLRAVRDDYAMELGRPLTRAAANARDEYGASVLAWAVIRNAPRVVDDLLAAGADPNVAGTGGVTPLALAAEAGRADMVRALLAHGAAPKAARANGETVLMSAVRGGSAEAVRLLLAQGADPNPAEGTYGQTALMWAAGRPDIVKLLLEAHADVRTRSRAWQVRSVFYLQPIGTLGSTGIPWVNAGEYPTTAGGETALMAAARAGDLASVRMIVAAGADVNQSAADGATPLLAALYNWRLKPVENNAATARLRVASIVGAGFPTPQTKPTFAPDFAVAGWLLDHGATVDVADGSGFTPLHAAVLAAVGDQAEPRPGGGQSRIPSPPNGEALAAPFVRRLLEAGADPNRATLWPTPGPIGNVRINPAYPGSTALHIAAQIHSPVLAELLAQHRGDPNRVRKDGHSPLSLAARSDDVAMMKVLARYGANFSATFDPTDELPDAVESKTLQRQRQSLMHIAGAVGALEAIRYLAEAGAPIETRNAQGETPLDLADKQETFRFNQRLEQAGKTAKLVRDTATTDLIRSLGGGGRRAGAGAAGRPAG